MAGAVLAGGQSRRMGRPKALIEVDGVPLAARAAAAVAAAGATTVVLVGAPPDHGDVLGVPTVPDDDPGEGPLAATATALASVPDTADIVLIVPCDQADPDPALLVDLCDALVDAPDAEVAVARTPDGRVHPFPAAWRRRAAGRVRALVDAGARRADAALDPRTTIAVPAPPSAVADLDTPEDLRRRLGGSPSEGAAPP